MGGEARLCVNPQHGNEDSEAKFGSVGASFEQKQAEAKVSRLQGRVDGSTAVVAMAVLLRRDLPRNFQQGAVSLGDT